MQESIQRLAERLYDKNKTLTIDDARTWVELLWEDFEATRAKAGRGYEGQKVTEDIVTRWIENYGPRLHEFVENNQKYKRLFEKKQYLQ
ncbi:YfhJ family protein [Aquibacillus kalidii]|uniref:YfhJ family protein n=1 Tax=Aquibacillus kalidii TaxID=2762597 RepID=UPI001646F7B7|nr:YfhJ family protein [Aquibacillus kalidii]